MPPISTNREAIIPHSPEGQSGSLNWLSFGTAWRIGTFTRLPKPLWIKPYPGPTWSTPWCLSTFRGSGLYLAQTPHLTRHSISLLILHLTDRMSISFIDPFNRRRSRFALEHQAGHALKRECLLDQKSAASGRTAGKAPAPQNGDRVDEEVEVG